MDLDQDEPDVISNQYNTICEEYKNIPQFVDSVTKTVESSQPILSEIKVKLPELEINNKK
ncbi:hypothetical protein MXB_3362 [Myxobolus squamalis]|nr:hypothetical protein MXB_3362 [Myxobolus squamalis]